MYIIVDFNLSGHLCPDRSDQGFLMSSYFKTNWLFHLPLKLYLNRLFNASQVSLKENKQAR